jgi:ribosomal protein S18 acetylase RimI-like enzyme
VELLSVEKAGPQDALSLLALRQELEAWLESRGVEQWGRDEVSRSDVECQVAADEWRVVRAPDGLQAAMRLLWSDEPIWQHQNTHAAYVHGLMVRRADGGRGLGAALLRWAAAQARKAEAPCLRLDCVESNVRLRAFYAAQGFVEVGRRDFDGPWFSAVLLEKALSMDAADEM